MSDPFTEQRRAVKLTVQNWKDPPKPQLFSLEGLMNFVCMIPQVIISPVVRGLKGPFPASFEVQRMGSVHIVKQPLTFNNSLTQNRLVGLGVACVKTLGMESDLSRKECMPTEYKINYIELKIFQISIFVVLV